MAVYRGRLAERRLADLAPVVVEAARDGDRVAKDLVVALADEVAGFAGAAIRRGGMARLAVPVVLAGGVARGAGTLLADLVEDRVRRVARHAAVTVLMAPPVLGAALLALDLRGGERGRHCACASGARRRRRFPSPRPPNRHRQRGPRPVATQGTLGSMTDAVPSAEPPSPARPPASIVPSGIVYAFQFAAVGVWVAYATVYFQALGVSLALIGILAAVPSAVAIVASPAWGLVADRLGDVRPPYLVAALWAAAMGAGPGVRARGCPGSCSWSSVWRSGPRA